MFMKTLCRTIDAEMGQQLARVPRVFAENQIGGFERGDRARREIRQISDRRSDQKKLARHAPECTSASAAPR